MTTPEMPRMECNCETWNCYHTQNGTCCFNKADGSYQVDEIGTVCQTCYYQYPIEYRKE